MKLLAFLAWALCACAPAYATSASINPVDYGAAFDGVTDDTAPWNAAVAAAVVGHMPIVAPCGTSAVSGTIAIPTGMLVAGGGSMCTEILGTGTGQTLVDVQTAESVTIRDIGIVCNGDGTGTGLSITPLGAANNNSMIESNFIANCLTGIDAENARFEIIHGNRITSQGLPLATGIKLGNSECGDCGGMVVSDNIIAGGAGSSGAMGIRYFSGGGARIVNNKIIGWDKGIKLNVLAGVHTSVLVIVGNSLENFLSDAIMLSRNDNTATFSRVVIAGNEIANCSYAIHNGSGSGWLSSVTIGTNYLSGCTTPLAMAGVTNLSTTGANN